VVARFIFFVEDDSGQFENAPSLYGVAFVFENGPDGRMHFEVMECTMMRSSIENNKNFSGVINSLKHDEKLATTSDHG